MVLLSGVVWGAEHIVPGHGIRILREGNSAVALCMPDGRRVLITDGDPFSTIRTIRLLQKEGISRVHELIVRGERADADAIRQIQTVFRPDNVRRISRAEDLYWPAEAGVVFISPER